MVVVLIGSKTTGSGTSVTTTPEISATVGNKNTVKTVTLDTNKEFFTVTSDMYSKTGTDSENGVHQTSMTEFNKIANAGTKYVEPSGSYQSYILKITGTETIVGIVIVPARLTISAAVNAPTSATS